MDHWGLIEYFAFLVCTFSFVCIGCAIIDHQDRKMWIGLFFVCYVVICLIGEVKGV